MGALESETKAREFRGRDQSVLATGNLAGGGRMVTESGERDDDYEEGTLMGWGLLDKIGD